MRRVLVAVAGAVLVALTVAGCVDNQPGDQNTGPGVADQVPDLVTKVAALRNDPCRGPQVDQIYPSCGRFATEVVNVVSTVHSEVPADDNIATAIGNSANSYLKLACETVTNAPTAEQQQTCPKALTAIGTELDELSAALATTPTSG